tara:strand:- start:177057 stop:177206 length:150 start_codon:yes stop_codon:yes gene_type:complete
MDLLNDIWGYLKERKKFWLVPIILIIAFTGLLLIFGAASGLGPFIYSIF